MQAGEFYNGQVEADLTIIRRRFELAQAVGELRNPHLESAVPESIKAAARESAVLIPILDIPSPEVLVTKRQASIRFGGQLCFPGGSKENAESDLNTALRETQEEIGLDPGCIEVLGSFGHYYSQSGFRITPFVGIVDASASYQLDPGEVASIHRIPLAKILDGSHYQLTLRSPDRGHIHFRDQDLQIGGPTVSLMIGLMEWLAPQSI